MDTGITQEMLDEYQRNGIIKVEQVISREAAADYREQTLALLSSMPEGGAARYGRTFHQYVDTWRDDEMLRELTLNTKIGAIAEYLAGIPLRLWHDHTLAKEPSKAGPTAFHQDQMKWPLISPGTRFRYGSPYRTRRWSEDACRVCRGRIIARACPISVRRIRIDGRSKHRIWLGSRS